MLPNFYSLILRSHSVVVLSQGFVANDVVQQNSGALTNLVVEFVVCLEVVLCVESTHSRRPDHGESVHCLRNIVIDVAQDWEEGTLIDEAKSGGFEDYLVKLAVLRVVK